jgi:hypothetical protein
MLGWLSASERSEQEQKITSYAAQRHIIGNGGVATTA